jgi:nicotinate-nucleotide adenylyltransferase
LAASYALATEDLDALAVFPSAHHPLGKEPRASFDQRVLMCRATFADLGRTRVDRLEQELGGEGFTLTLLRELRRRDPERELRLIVGQDILKQSARWHAWDEVVRLAPPLVVGRSGASPTGSSVVQMPEVSSSEIRRRFLAGESLEGLLHRQVLALLADDNPYTAERP